LNTLKKTDNSEKFETYKDRYRWPRINREINHVGFPGKPL